MQTSIGKYRNTEIQKFAKRSFNPYILEHPKQYVPSYKNILTLLPRCKRVKRKYRLQTILNNFTFLIIFKTVRVGHR